MLYVCATPIGNLQDVTMRVLEVLRAVEIIACEDTRHTRKLLERHDIQAQLISFHEHNEDQRVATLVSLLRENKDIAVVSDAGMPGVSDPGFALVRACVAEGLEVTVLPGPSAVSTALVLSGLPADKYAFVGFFARTKTKLLEQLSVFDGTGAAVVGFESPRRVRSSVAVIADKWPDRQMAVCRELTKLHEEVVRGNGAEILRKMPESVRGEVVVVMEPNQAERDYRDKHEAVERALVELMSSGIGTKKASTVVAGLVHLPRRAIYEMALDLAGQEKAQ